MKQREHTKKEGSTRSTPCSRRKWLYQDSFKEELLLLILAASLEFQLRISVGGRNAVFIEKMARLAAV
jgi:hypothetical protein